MQRTLPHILPLKGRREERGREGGGSTNWQKTLKENEFDRSVQVWIAVFLFPKSVRKAKALPPCAANPGGHCLSQGVAGTSHHIIFSPNYQRRLHADTTETQIISFKLLAGNQMNAGGFKMGGLMWRREKIIETQSVS